MEQTEHKCVSMREILSKEQIYGDDWIVTLDCPLCGCPATHLIASSRLVSETSVRVWSECDCIFDILFDSEKGFTTVWVRIDKPCHKDPATEPPGAKRLGLFRTGEDERKPIDLSMRDNFMDEVEPAYRGQLANLFLRPIRDGQTDPNRIVFAVLNEIKRQQASPWADKNKLSHLYGAVYTNEELALKCAEYYVDYENLPYEEKQRIKTHTTARAMQDNLSNQQPTRKQIDYLRSLGDNGPEPASKHEASQRINAAKNRRWGGSEEDENEEEA